MLFVAPERLHNRALLKALAPLLPLPLVVVDGECCAPLVAEEGTPCRPKKGTTAVICLEGKRFSRLAKFLA